MTSSAQCSAGSNQEHCFVFRQGLLFRFANEDRS
jgi:hypothetical protein